MNGYLFIDEQFGSTKSVCLLDAKTRRELSREVKKRNPGPIDTGCEHDCSGRICYRSAKLLRAYKSGAFWIGVVEITVTLDV